MEQLNAGSTSTSNDAGQAAYRDREARMQSIQRIIQSIVHACQCDDSSCSLQPSSKTSCRKMKRVIQHTKICKRKTRGECLICKQLIAVCCYHAKHCQEMSCSVLYCSSIKQKLNNPRVQERVQKKRQQRRHTAMDTPPIA